MSLSGCVDERLRDAVRVAYEAGNYSTAIRDSFIYLTELIRAKSGLDLDGQALIGSAFGGQVPVIKINTLHTESERDEQKGLEQILRGLYTAIRNPRAHEKRVDSVETADVVISFIGWVGGLIERSKSPFDSQDILRSVFDRHFPGNERYAGLLVERVPKRKRLEILIETFQRRSEGTPEAIRLFTNAMLKALDPDEVDQFWQAVSENLERADEDVDFQSIIPLATGHWRKVTEVARIRSEHRLIRSIKEGKCTSWGIQGGILGLLAADIATEFTLESELVSAISEQICAETTEARAYACKYFLTVLMQLSPTPPPDFMLRLRMAINLRKYTDLRKALGEVVDEMFVLDEWGIGFTEILGRSGPEAPSVVSDDEIPF